MTVESVPVLIERLRAMAPYSRVGLIVEGTEAEAQSIRQAADILEALTTPSPDRDEALKLFADDVTDVHSRIIIVHQLRESADIQSRSETARVGVPATTDRAELMRKAASIIERLASLPAPVNEGEREAIIDIIRDTPISIADNYLPYITPENGEASADAILSLRASLQGVEKQGVTP